MACNGLKMGSFLLSKQPKWSGIIFGETHFWPIFDPLFGPKTAHFQGILGFFGGPKWIKMCQKHLFWHSMWSRIIFEKTIFFLHQPDLIAPFWHPALWATTCSLPQPTGPSYGGLGVR